VIEHPRRVEAVEQSLRSPDRALSGYTASGPNVTSDGFVTISIFGPNYEYRSLFMGTADPETLHRARLIIDGVNSGKIWPREGMMH